MAHERMPTGALKAFIGRETQRILDACTSCGKCVEACPMSGYSAAPPGASSQDIASGVLSLLRGGEGSPQAVGWVSVCVRSGCCTPACPEKVDAKMMVRIARMIAAGGLGGPRLIKVHEDRDFYNRVRAFAALQLTDEEIREWM
jgi:Fe-S oxidoreductase